MSDVIAKIQNAITSVQSKLSTFDTDTAAKRKRLEEKLEKLQRELTSASVGADHRALDVLVIVVKGEELQGVLQGVTSAERAADWYKVLVGSGTADVRLVNVRVGQIKRNLTAEERGTAVSPAAEVPVVPATALPAEIPAATLVPVVDIPAVDVPAAPDTPAIAGIPGAEFQIPAV